MIPIATPATIERCEAALAAAPGAAAASDNAAAIERSHAGDLGGAIAAIERSLAADYSQHAFQLLLAEILIRSGRWAAYERRGEFGLDIVAALAGLAGPPERYDPSLVGKLFDRLSNEYEERVLREGYAEHTEVARAIANLPANERLRILDLGCGTGMLAAAVRVRDAKAAFIGVDMSEAMLERARGTGLYESLHRADIETFLRDRAGQLHADVAAFASVIPFFGDLGSLSEALAAFLGRGAWVVLSYDIAGGGDVEFNVHGRFRHSRAHVERRLADAGFDLRASEPFTARRERGVAVAAEVISARRR